MPGPVHLLCPPRAFPPASPEHFFKVTGSFSYDDSTFSALCPMTPPPPPRPPFRCRIFTPDHQSILFVSIILGISPRPHRQGKSSSPAFLVLFSWPPGPFFPFFSRLFSVDVMRGERTFPLLVTPSLGKRDISKTSESPSPPIFHRAASCRMPQSEYSPRRAPSFSPSSSLSSASSLPPVVFFFSR